ncbi:MAG: hypothetical protein QXE12_04140 [Conexivisphaerales archaeon]
MQYFEASKIGQERTEKAAEILAKVTGYAKGAIFLKHESEEFEPVGEENFYALIELRPKSLVIVLCDAGGNAKAISQFLHPSLAKKLEERLKAMNIERYNGIPYLPT